MINPNNLQAAHRKDPFSRHVKRYLSILHGSGYARAARTTFKRATDAQEYAIRLKERWVRLYQAAVLFIVEDDFVIVDDGFGNSVSRICPKCGQLSMQVVRPGKFQCAECSAAGPASEGESA